MFDWDEIKSQGISPSLATDGLFRPEPRDEFLRGAHALNFDLANLKPQQLHIADTLGLGRKFTGVLLPRRSTKTTSAIAVLIGRCLTRPGYVAGFTTGINALKARQRFRQDIMPPIRRRFPELEGSGFAKFEQTAGLERIVFDNGSLFLVGKPHEDWFRSEAFDCVLIDEAGEADAIMSESIVTGALPTMDTRPGAQVIYAGTAADFRSGNLLWDVLQREDRRVARLAYAIDQHTPVDELSDWATVAAWLEQVHPGIGTLTTLDDVRDNYDAMRPERFAREYLSLFGWTGEASSVLDPGKWHASQVPGVAFPRPPERISLGIAAAPDQRFASIAAAWRVDGIAHVLILESKRDVRWLASTAADLAKRYRAPIAHDTMGVVLVHTEELQRMRPRPRLEPFTTRMIATSAAGFVEAVESGRLRHYGQAELTDAVLSARRRPINGAWYFARRHPDEDITALQAASIALRAFDQQPVRTSSRIIRPS